MKWSAIFFVLIFVFGVGVCRACDICGSSSSGFYLTPYGINKSTVVGCRYSVQHFFSREATNPEEYSKDRYQIFELYGNVLLGNFMIAGSIPYKKNIQTTNAHPHEVNGIGDASILCNYILPTKSTNQVWIGGGVKLPIGRFDPSLEHHPVPSANLEPGTGSVDFLLNVANLIKLYKWSLIGNARYKINGDAKGFKFGNRFSSSFLVSRSIDLGKKSFNVFGGGNFDVLGEDKLYNAEKLDNGGYFLSGVGGLEMELGKFAIGLNGLLPFEQNLTGDQTKFRWGGMIQVGYRLSTKTQRQKGL